MCNLLKLDQEDINNIKRYTIKNNIETMSLSTKVTSKLKNLLFNFMRPMKKKKHQYFSKYYLLSLKFISQFLSVWYINQWEQGSKCPIIVLLRPICLCVSSSVCFMKLSSPTLNQFLNQEVSCLQICSFLQDFLIYSMFLKHHF